MDLEVGRLKGGQWQAEGSLRGPVSRAVLSEWVERQATVEPGTYEVRAPGDDGPLYLFRVGADGGLETVEVLDLD